MTPIIAITILGLVSVLLAFSTVKAIARYKKIENRYKNISEPQVEVDRLNKQLADLLKERDIFEKESETRRKDLEKMFNDEMKVFEEVKKLVEETNDEVEIQSFGFYKPRYIFATVSDYKDKLAKIRELQKQMLRNKTAADCTTTWQVQGSTSEGKKMVDRQIKLMLRAYNGECDAAVASVNWKNIVPLKERIAKAFEAINKLGETVHCSISKKFAELKLQELELAYDYAEKLQQEKEEKRQMLEQRREEERANKEIEAVKDDAEREENKYSDALERARGELAAANEKERAELDMKIAKLQSLLEAAQVRKKRAIAQAEMTRSGHVYILSNEGAFGRDVFKIGMTRRLDPLERVAELGGASVPFHFDVHAIIYSEDAPSLENKIHTALEPHRVNLVNGRKEFFRVPILRIIDLVATHHGQINFSESAEASDYRKTLAIKAEREAMVVGKDAQESAIKRVDEMRARFNDIKKKSA